MGPIDPEKPSARIVIFGGHYDGGSQQGFVYLNDTHVLDIDENSWAVPRCRGTAPQPRYGHSAALVGGRVVYFGGKGKEGCFRDLHALDTSSHTWPRANRITTYSYSFKKNKELAYRIKQLCINYVNTK